MVPKGGGLFDTLLTVDHQRAVTSAPVNFGISFHTVFPVGGLCSKPHGGASFCFGDFLLAILGRSRRFERTEQSMRDHGDVLDGGEENGFVRLRWLGEAADFPHELQRRGAHLVVRNRWFEVEENFDVSAHGKVTSRIRVSGARARSAILSQADISVESIRKKTAENDCPARRSEHKRITVCSLKRL